MIYNFLGEGVVREKNERKGRGERNAGALLFLIIENEGDDL